MLIRNISPYYTYNSKNSSANPKLAKPNDKMPQFCASANYNSSRYIPLFSCELERLKDPDIFNKIKMFKRLNPAEIKQCYEDIISDIADSGVFFTTVMGYKPACTIYDKDYSLDYLNRIEYKKPTTIIHAGRTINPEFFNSYILNRDMVYEIINKDKTLFAIRLNLNPNSSVEDIYSALVRCLSYNANSIKDLEGLILGFPKYNSILFQLDNVSRSLPYRDYPDIHRAKLTSALYDINSPYRKLPANEFSKINQMVQIAKLQNIPKNPYFQYVKFVDEPEAEEELFQKSRNFNGEFSAEILIND